MGQTTEQQRHFNEWHGEVDSIQTSFKLLFYPPAIKGCRLYLSAQPTVQSPQSITTLPPFGPIEGHQWLSRFLAQESLRRTGLHLSLSAKAGFYLPAFEIPRSCRTASEARSLHSVP
jgi:hypothetical protein